MYAWTEAAGAQFSRRSAEQKKGRDNRQDKKVTVMSSSLKLHYILQQCSCTLCKPQGILIAYYYGKEEETDLHHTVTSLSLYGDE